MLAMNLKKFYLIISIIISTFLFASGAAILSHINTLNEHENILENDNNVVNEIFKPFISGKDPVNFLVLVGDKGEANTDTMMLVNFNPTFDKLNILSIPRDTRVNISGLKIPKINSLYARKDGAQLVVNTVSDLLNVNINYYVYLNISTFRKIIDLLGGVEINVPVDMHYDDPTQNLHIHLKKGKQLLDGKKAEQFLRFRHPNEGANTKELMKYYDGSDIKRIEAQQHFIKELIRQKANILYLPKLNSIINTIYENLETNITLNEVMKLVKNISDFSINNVQTFTVPGESQLDDGIWYYIINKEETEKIIKGNFDSKGGFSEFRNTPKKTSSGKSSTAKQQNNTNESKNNLKENGEKDFIKNNPSNTETSIKGSAKPEP